MVESAATSTTSARADVSIVGRSTVTSSDSTRYQSRRTGGAIEATMLVSWNGNVKSDRSENVAWPSSPSSPRTRRRTRWLACRSPRRARSTAARVPDKLDRDARRLRRGRADRVGAGSRSRRRRPRPCGSPRSSRATSTQVATASTSATPFNPRSSASEPRGRKRRRRADGDGVGLRGRGPHERGIAPVAVGGARVGAAVARRVVGRHGDTGATPSFSAISVLSIAASHSTSL